VRVVQLESKEEREQLDEMETQELQARPAVLARPVLWEEPELREPQVFAAQLVPQDQLVHEAKPVQLAQQDLSDLLEPLVTLV